MSRRSDESAAWVSASGDDAHAVLVTNGDAVYFRQLGDAFDDAVRDLARGQHRTSPLSERRSKPLLNRINFDFRQIAFAEDARHQDVLPEPGMCDVSLGAAASPGVEEIGGRCVMPQSEAGVSFGREIAHALVLENEIANRVKDRLALVNFDAKRRMRSVVCTENLVRVDEV